MRYVIVLIFAICISCTDSKKNSPGITIIPQPDSIIESRGFFKLDNKATIYCSAGLNSGVINVFSDEVKDYVSLKQGLKEESDIDVNIEPGKKTEAYSLKVFKDKILISASTLNGAFNGLQSLRQLIIFSEKVNKRLLIPCCEIDDAPRYGWRGIMLDESRHFFGEEKVKQ